MLFILSRKIFKSQLNTHFIGVNSVDSVLDHVLWLLHLFSGNLHRPRGAGIQTLSLREGEVQARKLVSGCPFIAKNSNACWVQELKVKPSFYRSPEYLYTFILALELKNIT